MKSLAKKLWEYGPILIVIAASLWALDGIVRRSLYHLPPIIIVFYEHLIGSILLLPIVYSTLKKEKITLKLVITTLVVSLFGGLLGTLFITTALSKVNYIAFSVVFLIQKLQPLFAIGSAYFLLGEKLSKKYIKWAILALIATFFVTFKDGYVNFNTGSVTIVAALYALGAAICWGVGTTLSKMLLNQVSSNSATILRFYGSAFLAFIAVFIMGSQASLSAVGTSDIVRLIYIAFSTGLLAMILYYRGLKRTEVKTSTILELTLPVMAIIIDMVLYHVFLAPTQYLAALVLMFAMLQVGKISAEK